VNRRPTAVESETTVVVMHRAPRRQVVGQQPPGATGSVEIEDAVDHFAHVHRAAAATGFGGGDVLFDQSP